MANGRQVAAKWLCAERVTFLGNCRTSSPSCGIPAMPAHPSPCPRTTRYGICWPSAGATKEEEELKPDLEQAYMLGATALDCSIMLTFQEIEIECQADCPAGQR